MQFDIQSTISPFISSQFPEFYKTEGPNFILFVQAYYEFLEQQNAPTFSANGTGTSTNVLYQSRNLLNYRDIDNTLESFLEHFQKKYLYGIPFNVIINKRFLLKHILDVYRSKGSIQCYRLLFKLIYNEDIEIYLPSNDMLAPSDGTWVVPTYIEVTNNDNLPQLVGKTIIGLSSNTTAVVEGYVTEPINNNIVASLYISNIQPKGGSFSEGEKVIDSDFIGKDSFPMSVVNAPVITGSLAGLQIINGGQGFNIGDILGIVHNDLFNNDVISFGINGVVRVKSLTEAFGALSFIVQRPGFGITATPTTLVYPGNGNTTGANGGFLVGAIGNTQTITYNTDLIANYLTTTLNAAQYNFPANNAANLTSNIGVALNYTSDTFGSLITLSNIETGNGYVVPANVFIKSTEDSLALPGTVSFSPASNTVTGTGTHFTFYFANSYFIRLQANATTFEYQAIKTVLSDTSLLLYGPPINSSNGSSNFFVAPAILPANFTPNDPIMSSPDGSINGTNSLVDGIPSIGNLVVGSVDIYNAGKGYVDGEQVELYLYSGVNTPSIIDGGIGYSNGDPIIFSGGGGTSANGFVTTDANGTITSTTVTYGGSGLQSIPTISVQTRSGSGALLSTTLSQFNTTSQVLARVVKGGVGKGAGSWTTTRGFLNSDKYIQDSFFYQDYSYQIKAASQLSQYKDILYNTFHPAGAELFGEFQLITTLGNNTSIVYEPSEASFIQVDYFTADNGDITVDSSEYTVDEVIVTIIPVNPTLFIESEATAHAANAKTISLNLTVTDGNALLVFMHFGYSGHDGFSAKWDPTGEDESLQFIVTSDNGTPAPAIAVMGLLNPSAGTKALTMSFTSNTDNLIMSAFSLVGVNTLAGLAGAFSAANFSTGVSANATYSLPAIPGGLQITAVGGLTANGTPTGWGAGVTNAYTDTATASWGTGAYREASSTYTFTQSISASEKWAAAGVVVNPPAVLPSGTISVNLSNPIANGLAVAIPCLGAGILTDLITGKTANSTAGCTTDTSAGYGGGLNIPMSTLDRADFGVWQPIPQGDFTTLVFANPTTDNQNVLAGQCDSTASKFICMETNANFGEGTLLGATALSVWNGGGTGADDGGNDGTERRTTTNGTLHTGFADGNMHAFAGRVSGSTATTWSDGVNTTFDQGAVTGTWVNANQHFAIGNLGNYGSGNLSAGCTIVLVLVWNRALTDDEMASITANPFQVLK